MIQDSLFSYFYHFQNEEDLIDFAQYHTLHFSAKFLTFVNLEAAAEDLIFMGSIWVLRPKAFIINSHPELIDCSARRVLWIDHQVGGN